MPSASDRAEAAQVGRTRRANVRGVRGEDRAGVIGKVLRYDEPAFPASFRRWATEKCSFKLIDVLVLTPGQHVTFRVAETERGLRGIDVRPVESGGG